MQGLMHILHVLKTKGVTDDFNQLKWKMAYFFLKTDDYPLEQCV